MPRKNKPKETMTEEVVDLTPEQEQQKQYQDVKTFLETLPIYLHRLGDVERAGLESCATVVWMSDIEEEINGAVEEAVGLLFPGK